MKVLAIILIPLGVVLAAVAPVGLVQITCGIDPNNAIFAAAAGLWGIVCGSVGGLALFAVTDGF